MTIGDVYGVLTFIAGLLASGGAIGAFLTKRIKKIIQDEISPLNNKIDGLTDVIDKVDIDNCKNYMQQVISSARNGGVIDETTKQRFAEVYDHYSNDLHLNSYFHNAVEGLRSEGKL